jgi:hypothetical protein
MASDSVSYKWITHEWHLKDQDYVTVKKADKIEDKLEILKEVVNYLLEKYESTNH